jgi:hypothetical protein
VPLPPPAADPLPVPGALPVPAPLPDPLPAPGPAPVPALPVAPDPLPGPGLLPDPAPEPAPSPPPQVAQQMANVSAARVRNPSPDKYRNPRMSASFATVTPPSAAIARWPATLHQHRTWRSLMPDACVIDASAAQVCRWRSDNLRSQCPQSAPRCRAAREFFPIFRERYHFLLPTPTLLRRANVKA